MSVNCIWVLTVKSEFWDSIQNSDFIFMWIWYLNSEFKVRIMKEKVRFDFILTLFSEFCLYFHVKIVFLRLFPEFWLRWRLIKDNSVKLTRNNIETNFRSAGASFIFQHSGQSLKLTSWLTATFTSVTIKSYEVHLRVRVT